MPDVTRHYYNWTGSHHTNSVWFWRVREKCELRMPPCYFCVLTCDTSISYKDCMISHDPTYALLRVILGLKWPVYGNSTSKCTISYPTHTHKHTVPLYYIRVSEIFQICEESVSRHQPGFVFFAVRCALRGSCTRKFVRNQTHFMDARNS